MVLNETGRLLFGLDIGHMLLPGLTVALVNRPILALAFSTLHMDQNRQKEVLGKSHTQYLTFGQHLYCLQPAQRN
jgi:hypothetical protein